MSTKPLTAQQEAFVRAIASGKSQAEAYRTAYPKSRAWKVETVVQQACRLARLPRISARLAELAAVVEREFAIETADLLREAARIAFSDARRIMNEDGKLLLPHELDEETARAVASFEIDECGRVKYKFWDKNSALERLYKWKGLFSVDNRQKGVAAAEFLRSIQPNLVGVSGGAGAGVDAD